MSSCDRCTSLAERVQDFTHQLRILRDDIIEQATDTLWVGLTDTVCERITMILGDDWGKDGDTSSLRSRQDPSASPILNSVIESITEGAKGALEPMPYSAAQECEHGIPPHKPCGRCSAYKETTQATHISDEHWCTERCYADPQSCPERATTSNEGKPDGKL